LLRSEEEASWVVGPRERVRSEFSSAVTMLGQLLESKQQWTKAIDTYERALEVDYLIESFYLRLMHCHRDLDHRAEALSTYERCTRTLAAELGIEPSRELQTFGSALRNP
jgi:DNA-binding SARP family transcriptional activator